jgi:hypothetical protein
VIESEFAARIDKIRARFALRLADNIQQTVVALPRMAGDDGDAVAVVARAYRWFHDITGMGSTVGYEATGRHGGVCAAILAGPFRAQRGLSPDELTLLTDGLEALRIEALRETHSPKIN